MWAWVGVDDMVVDMDVDVGTGRVWAWCGCRRGQDIGKYTFSSDRLPVDSCMLHPQIQVTPVLPSSPRTPAHTRALRDSIRARLSAAIFSVDRWHFPNSCKNGLRPAEWEDGDTRDWPLQPHGCSLFAQRWSPHVRMSDFMK